MKTVGMASVSLGLLGLAALLGACAKHGSKRDGAAPVRFAYQNRIGSVLPILAVERGLFDRHGLAMKSSRFNSGPACAEALFTGAADIGTMGDTTAIVAMSRKAPLRIVASHANGEGRHRLIVGADSPFQSIGDLVGKRIGIKKGTSTYGGYLRYLEMHGIAGDRIEVVNLDPDTMPDALAAGSIQAFAASEPTPSLGELRGGRELATFAGQGNSFPILIVATERFVRERPEDLRRFLAALREAETAVANDPQAAAETVATSIGLLPEATAKAMARHEFRLNLDAEVLASLRQTAEFLCRQGVIPAVPEFAVWEADWPERGAVRAGDSLPARDGI